MSELDRLRKNVFENLREIERLNNIIDELERYLEQEWLEWKDVEDSVVKHEAQAYKDILDKLKELKERK